jgi:GDP-mannose 6-dehydrogenase
LIDSIDKTNDIQIQRAVKIIYKFWNKKLGFLGLSFKAGTDDLRNSPAVSVIESLLGKGCDMAIYDKNINLAMLTGTNKEYINSRIPHLATLLTDDPISLIEKSDVIIINTKEPEFIDLVSGIDNKTIIDFVRLDEMLLSKSNYVGINW